MAGKKGRKLRTIAYTKTFKKDYCQSASNSFQVSASKFFQLLRLI